MTLKSSDKALRDSKRCTKACIPRPYAPGSAHGRSDDEAARAAAGVWFDQFTGAPVTGAYDSYYCDRDR